jgi:hypothetical protein
MPRQGIANDEGGSSARLLVEGMTLPGKAKVNLFIDPGCLGKL